MPRRLRSKFLRGLLWQAADGECQSCGAPLPPDWHADHVVPWRVSRRTDLAAMQALCPSCNLRKADKMALHYRKHQAELRALLERETPQSLLAMRSVVVHATPGSGKSALPVIASHLLLGKGVIDAVVWVVPRVTLRKQAAEQFYNRAWRQELGHSLEVVVNADNSPNPAKGTFGYVTTYDAIRADRPLHQHFFSSRRVLLVLDEAHHVAEDSPTHASLKPLDSRAAFRLYMTGTLDRNENGRIAFLNYAQSQPGSQLTPEVQIAYGYTQAIADRALIRFEHEFSDAEGCYIDRDGLEQSFRSFSAMEGGGKDSLYAALATDYARDLLRNCLERWRAWRQGHPRSLMLVVCASKAQAREAQDWLEAMGCRGQYAVATSDDSPAAHKAIDAYRESGTPPILITVQMAYEGMDVLAITHVACLTHIRSFPWLVQMFGRALRYDEAAGDWSAQWAFFFVPDDPQMREAIEYLKREEALGVRESCADDDASGGLGPAVPAQADPEPPSRIVPLDSRLTRVRTAGVEPTQQTDHETTPRLLALMAKHGISGSVSALAALLHEAGAGTASLPPAPPAPPGAPLTATDRLARLRRSVGRLCRALDAHQGVPFGTWDAQCYRGPQRYRARDSLAEQDLVAVWTWLNDRADAAGFRGDREGERS